MTHAERFAGKNPVGVLCLTAFHGLAIMEARRDEILEELADEVQEVLSGEYEQFYEDENCFWYFVEMQESIFGGEYWIDSTFILWNVYEVKECFA